MELHLDMYQTLAIAVLVLLLGKFLKKKNKFSGKILYSGSGSRWSAFCHSHLRIVCNRNCRSFL